MPNSPKWRIQANKYHLHNSPEFSRLWPNAPQSFKISQFETCSTQVRTAMNSPNQPKTVRECHGMFDCSFGIFHLCQSFSFLQWYTLDQSSNKQQYLFVFINTQSGNPKQAHTGKNVKHLWDCMEALHHFKSKNVHRPEKRWKGSKAKETCLQHLPEVPIWTA